MLLDPSTRILGFMARKLSNIIVLGSALGAATWAYRAVGGVTPLTSMSATSTLALVAFWITFTLVNNILWGPYDACYEKKGLFAWVAKQAAMDGLLHAIAVLAGAGFAVQFNQKALGGIYLLFPVFVLLVLVLHRLTEQSKNLQEHLRLMRKLNEITAGLHHSLNLEDVLDEVARVNKELFDASTYFVALLDERSRKVQFARVVERGQVVNQEDVDVSRGLTGQVIQTQSPLFVDDVQREGSFRRRMLQAGDPGRPVHAVMMAPLMDKDRVIGVFSVQRHSPKAFRPFHRELFLSINHQVASAVVSARLYRRATEDSLTLLYNKSFFEERLGQSLAEGQPFGLLFFDCDDFKSVNDRFGHVVGDQYLHKLGRLIHNQCRGGDIPCRYGGDEFAILLPGALEEQTPQVAHRVQRAVNDMEFIVKGSRVKATVSIGTLWSDGSKTAIPVEDVLKKIDESLYKAKRIKNSIESAVL